MSSRLSCVVLAALSLVCPTGAVPQARQQGIALEVGAAGDLRQVPREGSETNPKPLMRSDRETGRAAASLYQASRQKEDPTEDTEKTAFSQKASDSAAHSVEPDSVESTSADAQDGATASAAGTSDGDIVTQKKDVASADSSDAMSDEAASTAAEQDVSGGADASANVMLQGASLVEEGSALSFFPDLATAGADLAHKATDLLYGMTGIGDDLDYPFACICGADGTCVGDSMQTKCSGRAGAGSGADD